MEKIESWIDRLNKIVNIRGIFIHLICELCSLDGKMYYLVGISTAINDIRDAVVVDPEIPPKIKVHKKYKPTTRIHFVAREINRRTPRQEVSAIQIKGQPEYLVVSSEEEKTLIPGAIID